MIDKLLDKLTRSKHMKLYIYLFFIVLFILSLVIYKYYYGFINSLNLPDWIKFYLLRGGK